MFLNVITDPSAVIARGIENLLIRGDNSNNLVGYGSCRLLARTISVTVFPIFLALELVFKRVPKLLISIPICRADKQGAQKKFYKNVEKIQKFCLGILFSPVAIGIREPDAVSGMFLKMPSSDKMIRPFGVEEQYGKHVDQIHYPETVEEIKELVKQANKDGKKISIIGAGMSQGPQTVPHVDRYIVINTKKLNTVEFDEGNKTVKLGSGVTWEQIQIAANQRGKSVIVKQASDIFSIGGSIGINCHGWAHEYGSIASTVESMEVIDADGNLRTLTPQDELFGCMFGTLGYFGVIVSATLKISDNEKLIERTAEVELDEFVEHYEKEIKNHDIPLFGGRLVLDNLDGNPARKVCMVRYERENVSTEGVPLQTEGFREESKFGRRIERIALQAFGHFSYFTTRRLISYFWSRERQLMLTGRKLTRNEALHPPINAFMMLHKSNLQAEWLQEYFIKKENLASFLEFLGAELKASDVRLINATIRPTPKDNISILPYADQDRYAVVICFAQKKTNQEIERTKQWMERVNKHVIRNGDIYYQAYMPFTTQEQFVKCYGEERVKKMRELKNKYDPSNIFGNGHTAKYFDINLERKGGVE